MGEERMPLKHKLQSRTWWAVLLLTQESFYLALKNGWSADGLALLWGTLLAIWVGNKAVPKMIRNNAAQSG